MEKPWISKPRSCLIWYWGKRVSERHSCRLEGLTVESRKWQVTRVASQTVRSTEDSPALTGDRSHQLGITLGIENPGLQLLNEDSYLLWSSLLKCLRTLKHQKTIQQSKSYSAGSANVEAGLFHRFPHCVNFSPHPSKNISQEEWTGSLWRTCTGYRFQRLLWLAVACGTEKGKQLKWS